MGFDNFLDLFPGKVGVLREVTCSSLFSKNFLVHLFLPLLPFCTVYFKSRLVFPNEMQSFSKRVLGFHTLFPLRDKRLTIRNEEPLYDKKDTFSVIATIILFSR